MFEQSRRSFLRQSMLAATAGMAAPGVHVLRAAQSRSPNERIGVAIVGTGGRGAAHGTAFASRADCEIRHLCDPDLSRANALKESVCRHQKAVPGVSRDIRKILEDDSVDVVSIASCNHWHALASIWAMQAGKDVYVEKPVSHNVSEGRRMVQAARKYQRICQTGTQYRSHGSNLALADLIAGGSVGEVKLAFCMVGKRRGSIGKQGKYDPPKNVDYDLFCGPAPLAPVTRPRFHYDWHWIWDLGNGDLGNSGIHRIDIARWALGVTGLGKTVISYGGRLGYSDAGETPNTQVTLHNFGDKSIVVEVHGLPTTAYKGVANGLVFEGTGGYVTSTQTAAAVFDLEGRKIQDLEGEATDHFDNFIQAVRSRRREDLNAEILEGHQSSALCHLGNISHRLGRKANSREILEQLSTQQIHDDVVETFDRNIRHLKDNGVDLQKTPLTLGSPLKMAPGEERFLNHPQANALLTRPYRHPFVVPDEDQV